MSKAPRTAGQSYGYASDSTTLSNDDLSAPSHRTQTSNYQHGTADIANDLLLAATALRRLQDRTLREAARVAATCPHKETDAASLTLIGVDGGRVLADFRESKLGQT